ncbi:hypothetical protein PG996_004668 [Apiospora saccharicola]|uniref:Uncharacterized protein n=1 Tax=Apiospora saccharicola TaxID=335842 RepID=A0ABR1W8K6_9PEZI
MRTENDPCTLCKLALKRSGGRQRHLCVFDACTLQHFLEQGRVQKPEEHDAQPSPACRRLDGPHHQTEHFAHVPQSVSTISSESLRMIPGTWWAYEMGSGKEKSCVPRKWGRTWCLVPLEEGSTEQYILWRQHEAGGTSGPQ